MFDSVLMRIVCSSFVQQPAAELFFSFDQLLLLKRGGHTVYFGSIRNRAKAMVAYFETISASKLPFRVNPANWMLDVLSMCGVLLVPAHRTAKVIGFTVLQT